MLCTIWFGFLCFRSFVDLAVTITTLIRVSSPRNGDKILMLPVVGMLMAFFSVSFWIAGFFLARLTVRSSFTQENLTITPWNFRIERTAEFWRRDRGYVNNAAGAEMPLTRMDKILCKQLEGATSDLTNATVRSDFENQL